MAIDPNKDYSLTGAQIEDLAGIVNSKANCSSLAGVAFSGSYNDLSDIPEDGVTIYSDYDPWSTPENWTYQTYYRDAAMQEPLTDAEIFALEGQKVTLFLDPGGDSKYILPVTAFYHDDDHTDMMMLFIVNTGGGLPYFYIYVSTRNDASTTLVQTSVVPAVMRGATASAPGAPGVAPMPARGAQEKILRGDATWTDDYVTRTTSQNNITGEKTFVGDKRIKFKGSSASSKMGFTCYDNANKEVGFLEATNTSGVKSNILGIWDTESGNTPNRLGFQYKKQGDSKGYNVIVPPKYPLNNTNTDLYIPLGISVGSNTVLPNNTGIVDISSILPSGGGMTLVYMDPGFPQNGGTATFYSDDLLTEEISAEMLFQLCAAGVVKVKPNNGSDIRYFTITSSEKHGQEGYSFYTGPYPHDVGRGRYFTLASFNYTNSEEDDNTEATVRFSQDVPPLS